MLSTGFVLSIFANINCGTLGQSPRQHIHTKDTVGLFFSRVHRRNFEIIPLEYEGMEKTDFIMYLEIRKLKLHQFYTKAL